MNKEKFVQLVSERRRKGDLTRGRAIHARCVDCVCYNVYAVSKCKERACPLWAYRSGLKEKPFPAGVPIRSKAIHDYCVECSGSAKEASGCPNKKCPLWVISPCQGRHGKYLKKITAVNSMLVF